MLKVKFTTNVVLIFNLMPATQKLGHVFHCVLIMIISLIWSFQNLWVQILTQAAFFGF